MIDNELHHSTPHEILKSSRVLKDYLARIAAMI
jgi:hypothetical protein